MQFIKEETRNIS